MRIRVQYAMSSDKEMRNSGVVCFVCTAGNGYGKTYRERLHEMPGRRGGGEKKRMKLRMVQVYTVFVRVTVAWQQ